MWHCGPVWPRRAEAVRLMGAVCLQVMSPGVASGLGYYGLGRGDVILTSCFGRRGVETMLGCWLEQKS